MGPKADPAARPLTMRNICPADARILTAIASEAEQAANWSEDSYRKLIAAEGVVSLLAERQRCVIGFVIGRLAADEAEILNLAVRGELRRQGEGSALLRAALEQFRKQGAQRVFLEVRKSNSTAIAFYTKHGFVQSGQRPAYYRNPDEDALCMEKKLTGPAD